MAGAPGVPGTSAACADRNVIGIDMDAALKIGAALGCDLVVLSELLPAAEAGLVEALRSHGVRDERP